MIEAHNLDAFYGQSHILHSIDFHLAEGESVALLGRNGAGKSTFLKSLIDAGPTVTGQVNLLGEDLHQIQTHKRAQMGMALVPEDRRIFPMLTVAQNIEIGGHAAGKNNPRYTLDDVVEMFPMLKPLLSRLGYQLSGGQQQMLAIARGIVSHPRLLMLDEPAEGLAPVIVDELADTVNALRKGGTRGMILTEQNVDFARQTTDRLYVLDVGSVVFSGTWPEFDANTDLIDRYLVL
ncbi:ABC branched chain amino acid transporter, ATPase subunit [Pseudooceanicola batsensis HTCC2597]|uniref:ABC branched chain amino acid transporter, ATPase subunit n=1 Tax=Pseudooceanicola batsensis (strain ATCC BAA-863 / DSM 15984 / KCTC 12145 / HTCC2597) TaxID=252305 RepID=A3TT29_PSEBH|nr:ABC transporter ATP-binding protein [Pseudooceanicola batsensis]EAQ04806.1 ABC branched chain amino acid transporter, ATPase subunit [Pseudooceanicola batsensis HTCC2597]